MPHGRKPWAGSIFFSWCAGWHVPPSTNSPYIYIYIFIYFGVIVPPIIIPLEDCQNPLLRTVSIRETIPRSSACASGFGVRLGVKDVWGLRLGLFFQLKVVGYCSGFRI